MGKSDSAKWLPAPGVRSAYTQDGAVLFDINKGLCYSLDPVAAQIWVTIEGNQVGITLEGIVDALETHFPIPRQRLESDTANWLNKLQLLGLVDQPIGQIVAPT